MSSEQTETEVFGQFPKKQHLSSPLQLPRRYHFCFLILNQVEKNCFSAEQTELQHIITSAVVTRHSQCLQQQEVEK